MKIFIFIKIYDFLYIYSYFKSIYSYFHSYYFKIFILKKNKVGLESCIPEHGAHMRERLTHILGGDENHELGDFNRSLTYESHPRYCYEAASNPIPRLPRTIKHDWRREFRQCN